MNHIAEDKLLEYALEVIEDASEAEEIKKHLDACNDCRARFDVIAGDVVQLQNIRPRQFAIKPPVFAVPQRDRFGILKAAALIIFGFAAGLSISFWTNIKPTCISPSYINPSSPPDSLVGYAAADATFYDNIPIVAPQETSGE